MCGNFRCRCMSLLLNVLNLLPQPSSVYANFVSCARVCLCWNYTLKCRAIHVYVCTDARYGAIHETFVHCHTKQALMNGIYYLHSIINDVFLFREMSEILNLFGKHWINYPFTVLWLFRINFSVWCNQCSWLFSMFHIYIYIYVYLS